MCLAIPGKVKEINGREAIIEYPQETRKAYLGDDVKVTSGDYVMVQMGVVVKKISSEEAQLSWEAWKRT